MARSDLHAIDGEGASIKRGRPFKTEAYKADKDDLWTPDTGYDRDKIYTRSTDGHGHSHEHRLKIVPNIDGAIAEMIRLKYLGTPIRTTPDYYRNAGTHQLYYDQTHVELPPMYMAAVATELNRCELEQRKDFSAGFTDMIKDFNTSLHDFLMAKDGERFSETLIQAEDYMINLRSPHREELAAVIAHHKRMAKLGE